ncbi:MAG TPA: hypothetical protein VIF12_00630, partial [Micavibrio sp.]
MKVDFKKVLLAGTAIVAVSSFAGQARAANLVMTANDVWADGGGGVLGPAAAGDNVDIDGFDLSITNDQTANDGSGLNTFILGDITDGDDSGNVIIFQSAGGTGGMLDVTADSANVGGDFTIDSDDGADQDVRVTVDNNLTVGGDLIVTNNDTDNGNVVELFVDGNLVVDGQTQLFSGDGYTMLDLDGNATFTGGVEIDESGGDSVDLVFDGAGTQTIAGDFTSVNGGEGSFHIANPSAGGV